VGRVLIPVDGSEPSLAAVDHFLTGPRWTGATLLCVLPIERQAGLAADREKDIESSTAEASRRMERAAAKFDVQVAYGDPASEILKFAQEGGYRRIMMGRRGSGRGRLAKALLGSVSEKVVREATIPVTLAD
jgi:nucleotide-binding universal stress UspA family protein